MTERQKQLYKYLSWHTDYVKLYEIAGALWQLYPDCGDYKTFPMSSCRREITADITDINRNTDLMPIVFSNKGVKIASKPQAYDYCVKKIIRAKTTIGQMYRKLNQLGDEYQFSMYDDWKTKRLNKGLSQYEASQLIREKVEWFSQPLLCLIENGKMMPNSNVAKVMEDIYESLG